jgi:hypothetical protein
MNVSDLENRVGAQLESIAAVVPEPIGRLAAAPVEAFKKLVPEQKAVIRPTLAITAATLGALVLGGWLRKRSATAGLSAVSDGLPGFRERGLFRRRRANGRRIPAAIGTVASGSFVLAAIQATLGHKITKIPTARGAGTAIIALALDRLIFGRPYLQAIQKALGWKGAALKYAAVGTA